MPRPTVELKEMMRLLGEYPPGYFFEFSGKPIRRKSSPQIDFISLRLTAMFVFYILSYLLSKTMGCFSGYLMSSAGFHKLFCGIYSAFKCSFDKFVVERVVFSSYSSTVLAPLPEIIFLKKSFLSVLNSVLINLFWQCWVFTATWAFLQLP